MCVRSFVRQNVAGKRELSRSQVSQLCNIKKIGKAGMPHLLSFYIYLLLLLSRYVLSSNYERGSRGGEIVETEQGIIDRDEIRHNFDVLSMYSDGLRKLFIVSIPLEYLCAPLTLILLYQLLTHPILFTSLHSQNAKTPECRTLIEEEFVRQLMAVTF